MRAFAAAWLVASLLLAGLLASSPQLHQSLHKDSNRLSHECAGTLLASGSLKHSACEPSSVAPQLLPGTTISQTPSVIHLAALLAFTQREHAPPALS